MKFVRTFCLLFAAISLLTPGPLLSEDLIELQQAIKKLEAEIEHLEGESPQGAEALRLRNLRLQLAGMQERDRVRVTYLERYRAGDEGFVDGIEFVRDTLRFAHARGELDSAELALKEVARLSQDRLVRVTGCVAGVKEYDLVLGKDHPITREAWITGGVAPQVYVDGDVVHPVFLLDPERTFRKKDAVAVLRIAEIDQHLWMTERWSCPPVVVEGILSGIDGVVPGSRKAKKASKKRDEIRFVLRDWVLVED